MRNAWRLVVFDVLAPLATIAALAAIGVLLGWPLWWVSTCSVLVLLVVEGVAINFWLLRRDSVTVGTDDDAPGLRLAVVFLCAAADLGGGGDWVPALDDTGPRLQSGFPGSGASCHGDGRDGRVILPERTGRRC